MSFRAGKTYRGIADWHAIRRAGHFMVDLAPAAHRRSPPPQSAGPWPFDRLSGEIVSSQGRPTRLSKASASPGLAAEGDVLHDTALSTTRATSAAATTSLADHRRMEGFEARGPDAIVSHDVSMLTEDRVAHQIDEILCMLRVSTSILALITASCPVKLVSYPHRSSQYRSFLKRTPRHLP